MGSVWVELWEMVSNVPGRSLEIWKTGDVGQARDLRLLPTLLPLNNNYGDRAL